jgi:hypothetical protein
MARSPTRKPLAKEFLIPNADIDIGEATIKYDAERKSWVLPDGPQQRCRYITSRAHAVTFANKLHQEISYQKQQRSALYAR